MYYLQTLFAWQRQRGRAMGIANGATGSVTFVPLPAPTQDEIGHLTERIARRLTAWVGRQSGDGARTGALMEEPVAALRDALSTAVRTPRLAFDELPGEASPLDAPWGDDDEAPS